MVLRTRVAAALVVSTAGVLLAGCGMSFDPRCDLLGVCERAPVSPVPRPPGASGSAVGVAPADFSVVGDVRTTSGLVARVRADLSLRFGTSAHGSMATPASVWITGRVEVTNTGVEEHLPITMLGYTVRAVYDADSAVCRAPAFDALASGDECWVWWGTAEPFVRAGRYVAPLAPGRTAGAGIESPADVGTQSGRRFDLTAADGDPGELEDAVRRPAAIVVQAGLSDEGTFVAQHSPPFEFEDACPYTTTIHVTQPVPVGQDDPGHMETIVNDAWSIVAASSRPISCEEIPHG